MTHEEKTINNGNRGKVFGRFIIYTLVVFSITLTLPIIIEYGDFIVFSENGPIEWLQLILIFASVLLFAVDARLEICGFKQLFYILAFLMTIAGIREMDLIFDRIIPVLGWKLPVFLCIAAIVLVNLKYKNEIQIQIEQFIRTRSFALLWCGFIVAVPYAQLVGHGNFLELLMGDDYMRDYKRVIEELGELMGYLLIMVGSLEAVLQRKED
mgnify:CR=1 FL=1